MSARILVLLLVVVFASPITANSFAGEKKSHSYKVSSDRKRSEVTIRPRGNRIFCQDFCDAVARFFGYKPKPKAKASGPSFAVDGVVVKGSAAITDKVLRPHVRVKSDDKLTIAVDHESIMNSNRDMKRGVRSSIASVAGDLKYGIEDINKNSKRQIVLLIHGLNSRPEDMRTLSEDISLSGFDVATFRYPNDQPVAETGKLLAKELVRVRKKYANRKVSIVAHSMGGLVARHVIENATLDPGNVEKLIMIGTPNHGSALARYGHTLDFWEYTSSPVRRSEGSLLFGSILDGLAEAVGDLRPESMFLAELNQLDRNPNVDYTHFIGTGGYVTQEMLDGVGRKAGIKSQKKRARLAWAISLGLGSVAADLNEIVSGKGDGLVSVKRARLAGVDDEVILNFHHNEVFVRKPSQPVVHLRRQLIKRLRS